MKTIISALLVSLAISVSAQENSYNYETKAAKKPHEYASKSVDAAYLLTKEGKGIHADYSTISQKGRMVLYGLSWDNATLDNGGTEYNTFALHYAQLYPVVNKKNKFFLNIGAGGFISYETAKNDILDESESKFSPGAKVKFECEFYMGRVCLFTGAEELYRPISIIGDWQWRASLGLRYTIR